MGSNEGGMAKRVAGLWPHQPARSGPLKPPAVCDEWTKRPATAPAPPFRYLYEHQTAKSAGHGSGVSLLGWTSARKEARTDAPVVQLEWNIANRVSEVPADDAAPRLGRGRHLGDCEELARVVLDAR
jgi:hypothetical protein